MSLLTVVLLILVSSVPWTAAMAVLADWLRADRCTWASAGLFLGPFALALVVYHLVRQHRA